MTKETSVTHETDMDTTSKPTAMIVGAGPSGLSATIGLCHRGWNVILIEKHESFQVRGANFGIAKNGIKALDEIYPNLVQDRMIDSKRSLSIPSSGSIVLPWWMMRDALLDQVKEMMEQPGDDQQNWVRMYTGCQVEDIQDDDDKMMVTVSLSNGLQLEVNVVIGADGIHSSIRDHLGLIPNEKTDTKIFRGTVEVPLTDELGEDATNETTAEGTVSKPVSKLSTISPLQSLLEKGMVPISVNYERCFFFVLNFHPHIPRRVCWVLSSTDPDFDPKKTLNQDDDTSTVPLVSLIEEKEKDVDKRELIKAIFNASTEDACRNYTEPKVTCFSPETLSQYDGRWGGIGRVTLIGDAAHAMRPTDGQGGNMAFEDVAMLCRSLSTEDHVAPPLSKLKDPLYMSSLLEQFERNRLPRVQKMHENQRLRYEARMRGEKVLPWSDEFREWVTNGI